MWLTQPFLPQDEISAGILQTSNAVAFQGLYVSHSSNWEAEISLKKTTCKPPGSSPRCTLPLPVLLLFGCDKAQIFKILGMWFHTDSRPHFILSQSPAEISWLWVSSFLALAAATSQVHSGTYEKTWAHKKLTEHMAIAQQELILWQQTKM